MEDILKIAKELQKHSPLLRYKSFVGQSLTEQIVTSENRQLSQDDAMYLHIEAQTYLLAEILEELRKHT